VRRASERYPDDQRRADLLRRTIEGNSRCAQRWRTGAAGEHAEDRKTIEHPAVGEITVDRDVLDAGDKDLKIVALTAPSGTPRTPARSSSRASRRSPTRIRLRAGERAAPSRQRGRRVDFCSARSTYW
jgi:MmyB-like transcription regulator ligand binding domain